MSGLLANGDGSSVGEESMEANSRRISPQDSPSFLSIHGDNAERGKNRCRTDSCNQCDGSDSSSMTQWHGTSQWYQIISLAENRQAYCREDKAGNDKMRDFQPKGDCVYLTASTTIEC
ncbi:uncharacterized protein APUU_21495S [Aspergillus puulaauensis]|uniref:Uncharacterized protein n=1 Tax=Aspergillus puulaauensis TaxID=1220207 RepID=A0A7R7XHH8_9EURO|nr:uncharacterized protein APUU_21495S [Aspergillus puulaauensis]BCS21063.1 hypothetical protein APUU_21495S [Aspergillus puulaauensis]